MGRLGSVAVANGSGVIINGTASGGTGTLTVGSLTFSGSGALDLDVIAGQTPLVVTGTLTTDGAVGAVQISASGSWVGGDDTLIAYGSEVSSNGTGAFVLSSLTGLTGHQSNGGLIDTGTSIAVDITGNLVWTGTDTAGGLWTTVVNNAATSATPSWVLGASGTTEDFYAGDSVQFNDSAFVSGTYVTPESTVTISGSSPTPGLMTFNNNTVNYVIVSNGGLGIAGGSLVMNGSGSVTLTTTNTYTGATTINAGTLLLASGGQLNGTAITVGTGGALSEDHLSTLSGNTSLTSAGITTLAGSNTYTGATTVTGGTTTVTGTLGATRVSLNGGTLFLSSSGAINTGTLAGGGGTLVETAPDAISGSATVVATAAGALTLSTSNNYTGYNLFNSGSGATLTVTNPGAASNTEFNFATGATDPILNLLVNGGSMIPFLNAFGGNSNVGAVTINVGNDGDGSTGGVIELLGTNGNWGTADTLNVTGSNGYSLFIQNISTAAGFSGTETLNPTTATLSVGSYNDNSGQIVTLDLAGSGTNDSIGNIVGGTLPLIQTSGTWTLSGTSTYGGTTSVTGGRLIVTGSLSATSAVNLSGSSAFIEADGLINNAATISVSGNTALTGTGQVAPLL